MIDEILSLQARETPGPELWDHAPIGMYRSAPDGGMISANPHLVRAINGFETEAELIAYYRDIATQWYVEPDRRAEFKAILERDGVVESFVSEVRRRDGRRLWVDEHAHVVRDEGGRPLYYEGTVADVTELVEQRQSAESMMKRALSAEADREAMMGRLAHELRGPLATLAGGIDHVSRSLGGEASPEIRAMLDDLGIVAEHGLQVVANMLVRARRNTGRLTPRPAHVDVSGLVAFCARAFAREAAERQVSIDSAAETGLAAITDGHMLRQILFNLVSNAIKYAPAGSSVLVEGRRDEAGGIEMAVSDEGAGIPAADRERIFQPYVRLGRQVAGADGLGLGLAIVRSLATAIGATVAVDPGKARGSRFVVCLPAASAAVRTG